MGNAIIINNSFTFSINNEYQKHKSQAALHICVQCDLSRLPFSSSNSRVVVSGRFHCTCMCMTGSTLHALLENSFGNTCCKCLCTVFSWWSTLIINLLYSILVFNPDPSINSRFVYCAVITCHQESQCNGCSFNLLVIRL